MLSISAARRLSAGARASRSSLAGRSSTNHHRIGVSSSSTRSKSSISRATLVGGSVTSSLRSQVPSLFYSTERIVSLRTGNSNVESHPKTVYDPTRETENCGVGMVASLKSVPSRRVVDDADEMLIRMSHRGGVGCCPASGDGAGKLFI